ncbi:MAG TPA: hypothetical protein VFN21_09040 [Acidimicrobiales bacterium]|nr:hypothetical protein [Acidimicrobiales bacterium]
MSDTVRSEADVPVAYTPTGGYVGAMPEPILAGCGDPLVDGAPDLRGVWEVTALEVDGRPAPADHPAWQHTERIEQAADRIVITGGGVVHDFRADGVLEHGVHDVMAADHVTPIHVTANFEDEMLVLRPEAMPDVVVRRWRAGAALVFSYAGLFEATMQRTDGTETS